MDELAGEGVPVMVLLGWAGWEGASEVVLGGGWSREREVEGAWPWAGARFRTEADSIGSGRPSGSGRGPAGAGRAAVCRWQGGTVPASKDRVERSLLATNCAPVMARRPPEDGAERVQWKGTRRAHREECQTS